MRIVAGGALALCSWMLHFRLLNFFRLAAVALIANEFDIGLRQYDFAVFRILMTGVARTSLEGDVIELLHQLGLARLVWIMTLYAVGGRERLAFMRLLQICGVRIMTIETQGRS